MTFNTILYIFQITVAITTYMLIFIQFMPNNNIFPNETFYVMDSESHSNTD